MQGCCCFSTNFEVTKPASKFVGKGLGRHWGGHQGPRWGAPGRVLSGRWVKVILARDGTLSLAKQWWIVDGSERAQ